MAWDLGLSGKSVLVTGGSSGIGRAVAREASSHGLRVGIIGRDEERLTSCLDSLEGSGHFAFKADLNQLESLDSLAENVLAEMGPLAGIVHAAGIYRAAPFRMSDRTSLEDVFLLNSYTPALISRLFLRKGYRAPGFSGVFLGSVSSVRGQAGASMYAASKGAISSLCKSLAAEYSGTNARFNTVIAGLIDTELSEGIRSSVGEEAWAALVDKHPLGLGKPEDVANAVMYLLSPKSRWITGTDLVVDGGYLAC